MRSPGSLQTDLHLPLVAIIVNVWRSYYGAMKDERLKRERVFFFFVACVTVSP